MNGVTIPPDIAMTAQKPDLVIGIAGCMAEHLRDKLESTAPHVSLVAGPDSYRDIGSLVDRARAGQRRNVSGMHLDAAAVPARARPLRGLWRGGGARQFCYAAAMTSPCRCPSERPRGVWRAPAEIQALVDAAAYASQPPVEQAIVDARARLASAPHGGAARGGCTGPFAPRLWG